MNCVQLKQNVTIKNNKFKHMIINKLHKYSVFMDAKALKENLRNNLLIVRFTIFFGANCYCEILCDILTCKMHLKKRR